jgi:hypothetical protein
MTDIAPAATAALQEAEGLVEAGRVLDAVRLLTRANRASGDPAIEVRLVELRHRAFTELPDTSPYDTWPRTLPDPFPDTVGAPPEVDLEGLSSDVLGGAIVNHGCLLVRGFLDPDAVGRLIATIDRAFDACDARNDGVPLSETVPWFAPFSAPGHTLTFGERWWVRNGEGVWTADSPRALFEVLEEFDRRGLGEILAGYLGEPPALSVKKCTLRRVPVETGTDWHQDGAFLGQGIRTVNVWLALTDCGEDAPGLDLVPKRLPLVETGSEGAQFDWSVGPGVVERVAGPDGVMRPRFGAGDALLFDERFLHRTGVSEGMTRSRYAIESWFFAPSHYPDPQIPLAY